LLKAVAPAAGLSTVVAIENGETVWKTKALFDTTNPEATGVAAPGTSLIAARRDHVHAGGGGDVATDTIWDALGDLAVGTGANTAAKLTVGADGKYLKAASGEATGLIWDTPAGAGDVIGPASNTDNFVPQWDGADSNTLKNGLELVTTVDATGSDSKIATEQAIREAIIASKVKISYVQRNTNASAGDDYTISNGSWAAVDSTNLVLTIPAILGDILAIGINAFWQNNNVFSALTVATIVSGSVVNFIDNGTTTAGTDGIAGWNDTNTATSPGAGQSITGEFMWTVESGDISTGNVTLHLYGYGFGAGKKITCRTGYPIQFYVKNLGQ